MRPAESASATRANGTPASTSGIDAGQPAVPIEVRAASCARCGDPDAMPTLAGDRALGPDHLYLVCDRCGSRWQRSTGANHVLRAD